MFLQNTLQHDLYQILVCHLTSDRNPEDTPKKMSFSINNKNQQTVVKVISQVQKQKIDSLLQINL